MTISKPAACSFPTVSGTSATLRSSGAVSCGTPTLIAANSTGRGGRHRADLSADVLRVSPRLAVGDALLHASRLAVALRRRDARVVRHPAAGRDRAHLLRRAGVA